MKKTAIKVIKLLDNQKPKLTLEDCTDILRRVQLAYLSQVYEVQYDIQ